MVLALSLMGWAKVAAPVFAAVAACASWAAVWQSRKAFEDTLLPRLVGVWKDPPSSGGPVTLEIANTGSGFAHSARVYVIGGSQYAWGPVTPTGLMLPQEVVHINAQLPAIGATEVVGVLFCEDLHGRWHVWSWTGKHRRPRTRLRRPVKDLKQRRALHMHFPHENDTNLSRVALKYH